MVSQIISGLYINNLVNNPTELMNLPYVYSLKEARKFPNPTLEDKTTLFRNNTLQIWILSSLIFIY